MIGSADESRSPTILVANDHEWSARSLETILIAEGLAVVRAFTANQALEKAAEVHPDACILDVQLPDLDGMSLCEALRQHPAVGPAVPIFLTTAGPSGRQERLAAYRAGAWDFFGQPLDGESLLLKLHVYLESKAVADRLRSQSLIDELTGLYSRRGLVRRGQEVASDAARQGRPLGCVVLRPDLPDLDAYLQTAEGLASRVGDFLRSFGRSADALGRVGPLEFGVIASGAGDTEIRQLVQRLSDGAIQSGLRGGLDQPPLTFRAAFCTVEPGLARGIDLDAILSRTSAAVAGAVGEPLITALS